MALLTMSTTYYGTTYYGTMRSCTPCAMSTMSTTYYGTAYHEHDLLWHYLLWHDAVLHAVHDEHGQLRQREPIPYVAVGGGTGRGTALGTALPAAREQSGARVVRGSW